MAGRFVLGLSAVFAVVVGGVGCSMRDYGESALPKPAVAAAPHGVDLGVRSVELPGSDGFNVYDNRRYASGQSRAEADAEAGGTAGVAVDLSGVGEAWSEFEVGQVFPAPVRGGRSAEANVRAAFTVEWAYRFAAPDPSEMSHATGRVGLKIVVLDSDRHLVRKEVLTETSPVRGADDWSGRQTATFTLALDPDLAYHFLLAGRAELKADEPCKMSASLKVTSFSLRVTPVAGVGGSAVSEPRP